MLLLLIEDDRKLARTLAAGLEEEHFLVSVESDGHAGLRALTETPCDVCILDINLPGQDGFAVLKAVRQAKVTTPILVLTARDVVTDRIHGLNNGADDYLTKPFVFAELLARLHALLRRGGALHVDVMQRGALQLHLHAREVRVEQQLVALTPKQFSMLELLLRHEGEVVTRAMLLSSVWGYAFDPGTNLVDVHMAQLRRKLEQAGQVDVIRTLRGVGYRVDKIEPA